MVMGGMDDGGGSWVVDVVVVVVVADVPGSPIHEFPAALWDVAAAAAPLEDIPHHRPVMIRESAGPYLQDN